MNDAVSPEKPSKRRGARDDDWSSSSSSFASRFPLSFFFFVVAKRAKERPLMTLFFSLFFSSSQPTTQKRTSRVISLSLFICEVDESLRRLARLSGVDFSPEIADAVIELCRANVSPVAIVSVLKSLAGRRREEHNSAMSSPL